MVIARSPAIAPRAKAFLRVKEIQRWEPSNNTNPSKPKMMMVPREKSGPDLAKNRNSAKLRNANDQNNVRIVLGGVPRRARSGCSCRATWRRGRTAQRRCFRRHIRHQIWNIALQDDGVIADSGDDAGHHDQRIVQGPGETADGLVVNPPKKRDARADPDADRTAPGFANPGRVYLLQLGTPCPCGSPST